MQSVVVKMPVVKIKIKTSELEKNLLRYTKGHIRQLSVNSYITPPRHVPRLDSSE